MGAARDSLGSMSLPPVFALLVKRNRYRGDAMWASRPYEKRICSTSSLRCELLPAGHAHPARRDGHNPQKNRPAEAGPGKGRRPLLASRSPLLSDKAEQSSDSYIREPICADGLA